MESNAGSKKVIMIVTIGLLSLALKLVLLSA